MINIKTRDDLNFELKGIANLPYLNKTNKSSNFTKNSNTKLIVKDFYLELIGLENSILNKVLTINKNSIDTISLIKIKKLIESNCISCIIKSANQWYKVQISFIKNEFLQIKLIRKINSLKELNTIHYLIKTIKKLKIKVIPKPVIQKYISNYLEYNCISG